MSRSVASEKAGVKGCGLAAFIDTTNNLHGCTALYDYLGECTAAGWKTMRGFGQCPTETAVPKELCCAREDQQKCKEVITPFGNGSIVWTPQGAKSAQLAESCSQADFSQICLKPQPYYTAVEREKNPACTVDNPGGHIEIDMVQCKAKLHNQYAVKARPKFDTQCAQQEDESGGFFNMTNISVLCMWPPVLSLLVKYHIPGLFSIFMSKVRNIFRRKPYQSVNVNNGAE